MNGYDTGPIFYLLPARRTGRRHYDRHLVLLRMHRLSNTGKQNHFSYFQRCFIMLLFISERAGHTTTSAWDDMDFRVPKKVQNFYRLLNPHKSFLMAMSVQPYFYRGLLETIGRYMSFTNFRHDKFIIEQAVLCKLQGILPFLRRNQVGIFITERQNTGRFNSHKGSIFCNNVFQKFDKAALPLSTCRGISTS